MRGDPRGGGEHVGEVGQWSGGRHRGMLAQALNGSACRRGEAAGLSTDSTRRTEAGKAPTGDTTMLRKFLLPGLAVAALAGCATDYAYRGGNGDYYYGQPRVEYRYYGGYAPYGGYLGYGYGGGYYYDRYGRLVYASPFGGYYGYPYAQGGWWYSPRPGHGHHDHGGDDNDGDEHDGDRSDRPPPWRDIGGVQPRPPRIGGEQREDARARVRRQPAPQAMPVQMPRREPRTIAPREHRMGGESSGGSRMGRAIRSAKSSGSTTSE